MKTYQKGFVPALGTPLTKDGDFIKESFVKQINAMIDAGAIGLLAMGSMGIQATLKSGECRKIAEAAVEAAAGRVPVYVGAMDCLYLNRYDELNAYILRISALSLGHLLLVSSLAPP